MARVIKAGAQGGQKPPRSPTRMVVDAGSKKVIERAVYQAKQDAEHILKRADEERERMLAEGRRRAARAREESMARGASEAFATAASEALLAFRRRAQRYAEASDDIRALALEVVKKVLGTDPDLSQKDVERILQRGMDQLRARRRLRVQVSPRRLGQLGNERPNLMKALQSEPDLVVEASDDVGFGFARVVTEIGGALCAEETALDALALAVNVHEQPRDAPTMPRMARAPSTADRSDVPEADVEEDQEGDDTIQMVAQKKRTSDDGDGDDVEEIDADEDGSSTVRRPKVRGDRVPTGQVQAPTRPATRVVPIGSDDRSASTSRSAEAADEDLELFTDDAVGRPRRKR